MSFTHVLRSDKTRRHYVGHTSNLQQRLGQHNNGITKSTKNRGPWTLVHSEEYATRAKAARRERFLETGQGREQLKELLGRAERSSAG